MRPDSIKKFDLLYLASIVVQFVAGYLDRDAIARQLVRQFNAEGAGDGGVAASAPLVAMILLVVVAALQLLLWYLVSRQKIGLVRYVIVLVLALHLLGLPAIFANITEIAPLVTLLALILQVASVYFLFRAETTIWLKGKRVVDSDIVDDGTNAPE